MLEDKEEKDEKEVSMRSVSMSSEINLDNPGNIFLFA